MNKIQDETHDDDDDDDDNDSYLNMDYVGVSCQM